MSVQLSGQLPKATQENVLVLLCFDTENYGLVHNTVSLELFDPPYYREIAAKAFAYIDKYKCPPKEHIADELTDQLASDKGSMYRDILTSLYASYKHVNTKYVIDTLTSFVENQRLQNAIIVAANQQKAGDLEKAKTTILQAVKDNIELFNPGIRLSDVESGLRFDESEEPFSTGIGPLDLLNVGPTRGELTLFIAAPNKGKSWWLIHLGKVAVFSGLRTCHVTLELSQKQTYHRYLQSVLSLTQNHVEHLESPIFERDDRTGRITGQVKTLIERPSLSSGDIEEYIYNKFDKYGSITKNLIIRQFPTSRLTISQLEAYLDGLHRTEGFDPDLLIIDYADLMSIDRAQYRLELNELFEELRGLAVERNVAVATASQANRAGSVAKLITGVHASEAYGKIATADTVLTYTQTLDEFKRGTARLHVDKTRSTGGANRTLFILQNYTIGQFCLDSMYSPAGYDSTVGFTGTAEAVAVAS